MKFKLQIKMLILKKSSNYSKWRSKKKGSNAQLGNYIILILRTLNENFVKNNFFDNKSYIVLQINLTKFFQVRVKF